MSQTVGRWMGGVAVLVAGLTAFGCAALEAVEAPRGHGATLHGEVRSVDTRSARLHLREDRGRNQTVRYDNRTRVVYRQQSYPVSALERGDRVAVRVVYDRSGQPWADRIDVRESVRDRGRTAGRTQRLDGTVSWVDTRRGSFSVSPQRGRSIVIHAPRNLSRSDEQRLNRLRRGDRVRVEVRALGRDQYELVRFR